MFTEEQRRVCERLGAQPVPIRPDLMVGLAECNRGRAEPVHGLRHPVSAGTTGWFIWSGELSSADDFFNPIHAKHLETKVPVVVPYLALSPGWRFLVAPGYEDVWYDETLLDV